MKNIIFYPTITNELLRDINFRVSTHDYSFYYRFKDEKYNRLVNKELTKEVFSDAIYIKDDLYGYWNPKEYNLNIRANITIKEPYLLFGEEGIASSNSKILICLKWHCRTTNLKGINHDYERHAINETSYSTILLDKNSTEIINKLISVDIPAYSLKNDVHVSICFISVLNPDINDLPENEKFLNHNDGDVLGELGEVKIVVEGDGSEFPIVVENKGNDFPLWYLHFDSDNPNYDQFTKDKIKICFNEDHPDFHSLELENFQNPTPLFKEIFASSICQIIQEIKDLEEDYYENTISGKNLEEGSISKAMNYFIHMLDIDTSSYRNMMISVRKNVAKRL